MTVKEISERVQGLHKEATVIDMLEGVFPAGESWSPAEMEYFKTLVDAGVAAVHGTVPFVSDDLPAAIIKICNFYKAMEGVENAKMAFTAADIESAKTEGKVAIIAGMQDSIPFERNLDLIRVFHKLGIKVIQLAYYHQNYLGAGCVEQIDHGLTGRGREAVKELNRLGIVIDASHCGDKTAMDAAECSKDPIAITHSTPATLVEMRRARSDDTIKAVAEKGGVIGQVIMTTFCEKRDKMGVRATLSDFVDIIDYLVNLAGTDHVGLGMDVVPFWTPEAYWAFGKAYPLLAYPHKQSPFEELYVEGFKGISDAIRITEELSRHGYSDDDTKKIMGGNWLRLLKEVWK